MHGKSVGAGQKINIKAKAKRARTRTHKTATGAHRAPDHLNATHPTGGVALKTGTGLSRGVGTPVEQVP